MTTSYTYAILDVSPAVHAEIAAKLRAAGYDHAFHDEVIDMHGIAIRPQRPSPTEPPSPPNEPQRPPQLLR